MNEDIAPSVRLDRTPVIKRRTDEADSSGPNYARTRRHLWLWSSPVPPQRLPDVMDKLLPVIARAMYREGWTGIAPMRTICSRRNLPRMRGWRSPAPH